jgi:hypothetical protein
MRVAAEDRKVIEAQAQSTNKFGTLGGVFF